MKPDRVGTIRRARGENSCELCAGVIARTDALGLAIRLMEPREEHNLVSNGQASGGTCVLLF